MAEGGSSALPVSKNRSTITQSGQTPSNFRCRRWNPISSKLSPFNKAQLAMFSGNTRLVSLHRPLAAAPLSARRAPRGRGAAAAIIPSYIDREFADAAVAGAVAVGERSRKDD